MIYKNLLLIFIFLYSICFTCIDNKDCNLITMIEDSETAIKYFNSVYNNDIYPFVSSAIFLNNTVYNSNKTFNFENIYWGNFYDVSNNNTTNKAKVQAFFTGVIKYNKTLSGYCTTSALLTFNNDSSFVLNSTINMLNNINFNIIYLDMNGILKILELNKSSKKIHLKISLENNDIIFKLNNERKYFKIPIINIYIDIHPNSFMQNKYFNFTELYTNSSNIHKICMK